MRFIFLFSGFLGFLLVMLAGWSAGRALDLVLRDAAFGCLAGGLIGRWFWRVLQSAVAQTAAQRRAAADAAAAAEAAKAEAAPPPRSSTSPGASTPVSAPPAAPHRAPTPVSAR